MYSQYVLLCANTVKFRSRTIKEACSSSANRAKPL